MHILATEEDEDEISEEVLSKVLRSSSSPLSSLQLESEVESECSPPKRSEVIIADNINGGKHGMESKPTPETGMFSDIPPEVLYNILKFLSSEDLVSCSLVCRFMNFAASDESLWRRLYCMRWGSLPPEKPRDCAWKKLYIKRDEDEMRNLMGKCPTEFKEYYIQMQVNDDLLILDKTLADQVSTWKISRGLSETVVLDHDCSGESCTYPKIGDAFVCENTGNVHVCHDKCKDVVMGPRMEAFVCTISGRCFNQMQD